MERDRLAGRMARGDEVEPRHSLVPLADRGVEGSQHDAVAGALAQEVMPLFHCCSAASLEDVAAEAEVVVDHQIRG